MLSPNYKIIEILQHATSHVISLIHLYDELPKIIENEHEAISQHDIKLVEKVGKQKREFSQDVDEEFQLLVNDCKKLFLLYQKWSETTWLGEENFSQILLLLEEISGFWPEEDRMKATFLNEVQTYKEKMYKFQKQLMTIKPMVDRNKFVIAKLLHNHQQSYLFWQELLQEHASSYDASGTRKNTNTSSNFQTKA